ncbi:MAG: hypothetical protein WDM96_14840 [Lacunisphaera sp.]
MSFASDLSANNSAVHVTTTAGTTTFGGSVNAGTGVVTVSGAGRGQFQRLRGQLGRPDRLRFRSGHRPRAP